MTISPDAETGSENSVSPAQSAPAVKRSPKRVVSKKIHVVSGDSTDSVHTSALVRNDRQRKSLSVHHLQRRLVELGYAEAGADLDGFLGDLTRKALTAWQEDNGYPAGVVTGVQANAIFSDDPNVTVVVDTIGG